MWQQKRYTLSIASIGRMCIRPHIVHYRLLRLFQPFCNLVVEQEIVQFLVVAGYHLVTCAFPPKVAVVDKYDMLAYLQHGIHVVGVDDGGDVQLLGDFLDQLVDKDGGLRVEAGVGLVAEQVFGIGDNGAGYGHTFAHAAAELGGEEFMGVWKVHTFEAEIHTFVHLGVGHFGEHQQGELHVLGHGKGVEQGSALEHHANFAFQCCGLMVVHGRELTAVVENLARSSCLQAAYRLHQHRLTRAAAPDDKVGLARLEHGGDAFQHLLFAEILIYVFYLNHSFVK